MQDKDSVRDFYLDVQTVASGFLGSRGLEADDIGSLLESEFEELDYPVNEADSSGQHVEASFGLSYLVADELSRNSSDPYFFSERAEDFRSFYENSGYNSQSYGKNEFIQFANLYAGLTREEELEVDSYPAETLVLKNKSEVEEVFQEFLSELADEY